MAIPIFAKIKYMSVDPNYENSGDLRIVQKSVYVKQFVAEEVWEEIIKKLPNFKSPQRELNSLIRETQAVARKLRMMQEKWGTLETCATGIKAAKQEGALIKELNKLSKDYPRIAVLDEGIPLTSNVRDIKVLNTFLNTYAEHQNALKKYASDDKVVSSEAAGIVCDRAASFETAAKELVSCCGERSFLGDFVQAFAGKATHLTLIGNAPKR